MSNLVSLGLAPPGLIRQVAALEIYQKGPKNMGLALAVVRQALWCYIGEWIGGCIRQVAALSGWIIGC